MNLKKRNRIESGGVCSGAFDLTIVFSLNRGVRGRSPGVVTAAQAVPGAALRG